MLRDDGTSDTFYIATDHLGSSDVILKNSAVHVYTSFDAFGQRRDPTDWTSPINSGDWPKIKSSTRRGFTGHEHLDNVGLIHMNGRVQDPVVGRFLSADPFVQAPYFSESLNRYSYTFNSPLSYTDPSGFAGDRPKIARIEPIDTIVAVFGFLFGGPSTGANLAFPQGIITVSGGGGGIVNSNAEMRGGAGAGSGGATFSRPHSAIGQPDVQDFTIDPSNTVGERRGAQITEQQLELATNGDFMDFWRSRHLDKDPVARTALTGWGDPDFVDATLFERLAATYTWYSMKSYIRRKELDVTVEQIGAELALAHAQAVMGDRSGIPYLLSPQQVADYHYVVFERHNIPAYIFGGTLAFPGAYAPVPGGWAPVRLDANTYSARWCRGCDSVP